MSDLIYPTELACKAIGLNHKLDGTVNAPEDGFCALCGKPYREGENVDVMKMNDSFTLNMKLSNPTSPYRCIPCARVTENQDFLKKLGSGVTYEEGIFPCLSKKDRGYWLLNPPKPPYLFNIQVSKSQHLIWRSVVNYSQDIIFIRLGEEVQKIRVNKLKEGKAATHALVDAHKKAFKAKLTKRKPTRTVLTFSHVRGQRIHQSEFYDWVTDIVELYPDTQQHIDTLKSLTSSEAFALDFVLDSDYEQPLPIRTQES